MEYIQSLLSEFRNITIKAIDDLRNEKYEELNLYLEEREKIINQLRETKYDSNSFIIIVNSLELEKWEKEFNKIMNEKRQNLLIKIKTVSNSMTANDKYINSMKNYSSYFFNKKI